MPLLSSIWIKLAGLAALAALAFFVGWSWQGALRKAEVQGIRSDYAVKAQLASDDARDAEKEMAARLNGISVAHYQKKREEDAKEQALRRSVADGSVQLRVWVQRATVAEAHIAAGRSVDNREAAILDPNSRSDYHALRENILGTERQLNACIDQLIAERLPTSK